MEGDAEGFDAVGARASRWRIRWRIAEQAGRRTGGRFLRRRGGERVELPLRAESRVAHLPVERQKAAAERGMRPVRGKLDMCRVADGREGELAGADDLERQLQGERTRRAGIGIRDVDMEATRMRRVAGARQHRRRRAVDAHHGAAHAARIAEGDEDIRRFTLQAGTGMLGLRHQRRAVVPGGGERRLHDVAVDLEDTAMARLDRGARLDVEQRGGGSELPGAPLRHGLSVPALALGRFPALDAITLQDRTEHGLVRGQAGGDAGLGLAQPPFALRDDAADGAEREHETEQHGGDGDRLAEQGKSRQARWRGHGGLRGGDGEGSRPRSKPVRSACEGARSPELPCRRRATPQIAPAAGG